MSLACGEDLDAPSNDPNNPGITWKSYPSVSPPWCNDPERVDSGEEGGDEDGDKYDEDNVDRKMTMTPYMDGAVSDNGVKIPW